MSLKDITITGSIGSIATQSYGQKTYISSTDNQSFPLEHITGSDAKAWPNFVKDTNYTVKLVTNVTQSWSGSNITPLGIVPYVHNTMEEFINGEFSGSSYVVTDGSLTDAQCEQFLTVGTTPINYSIFPYTSFAIAGIFYYSILDLFLNINTIPRSGEFLMHAVSDTLPYYYTNTYITYVKISRYDKQGNDNTLSLQELKQFRWTDSTAGEVILNVENINEHPSYYLYKVKSKTWVNLPYFADDNVLDYSFNATATNQTANSNPYYINNYTSTINGSGQFNGTYYSFALTPNTPIIYTASLTAQNTSGTPVTGRFSIYGSNNFVNFTPVQTSSFTIGASSTQNLILTGSTQGFLGYTSYWTEFNNLSGNLNLTNILWKMTQSAAPQLATSSAVIEPYLLSTFTNSDCDVLMNNADLNDVSNFYREVLYDNGGTTPSNLQQIISGTAEYAQINDYLYNANANVLPRYQGVRTTSNGFNLPSVDGFTNEELANFDPKLYPNNLVIDNNKGTPSVEQTTTYFGYFDSLKANWPIFLNSTSPVLKYLIKEDGTVFSPSSDEATYWNIVDSFERGKKAYTSLLNDTTIIFSNTSSILLSGQSYTPILYNISASTKDTAGWSGYIDFQSIDGGVYTGTPPNYSFNAKGNANTSTILSVGETRNIFENTTATDILYDYYPGFSNTTAVNHTKPWYQFNGVPQTSVNIRIRTNLYFPAGTPENNYTSVYLYVYKIDAYNVSTLIGQSLVGWNANTQNLVFDTSGNWVLADNYLQTLNVNIYNFIPLTGDKITAVIYNFGPYDINVVDSSTSLGFSYMKILPNNAVNPTSIPPDYFITGSNNGNSITSSITLGQFLGGNYKQQDIEGSGFDPIELPCDIQVGDEIRFEYNEDYTYRVIEIIPSGSGGYPQYCYTLDKIIPSSAALNINRFTVRRLKKDSITGIALDKTLIAPINSGFLLPEYPSSAIKKNLPNIINDLYNRTLI